MFFLKSDEQVREMYVSEYKKNIQMQGIKETIEYEGDITTMSNNIDLFAQMQGTSVENPL